MSIYHLDFSSLSHSACEYHLYNDVVVGYKVKEPSVDMEYGSAVHHFAEHFERTKNARESLDVAIEYLRPLKQTIEFSNKPYLNEDHLRVVCAKVASYISTSVYESVQLDKEFLIELPFSIPFTTATGVEIMISGTMDKLAQHVTNQKFFVRDWKTTSMWDKDEYLESCSLSAQLKVYCWAIRKLAQLFPESIYAVVANASKGYYFAAIDAIFLKPEAAQTVIKSTKNFAYSDAQLDELEALILVQAERVIDMIADTSYRRKSGLLNGACLTKYGKCKYYDACNAPDKACESTILKNNFKIQPYVPTAFRALHQTQPVVQPINII